jgi:type I restriction enzyme R subunit
MLDEAIQQYNNRMIDAAAVVEVMVKMRQQQLADEQRKRDLGLSDEELGFYDVVQLGAERVCRRRTNGSPGWSTTWFGPCANLKVDWTKAHRKDVYAGVESAVKLVLRRRQIKGEQFKFLLHRLMQQAEASYADWPLAA